VELQIDAKQILQQALGQVGPGEDIDEAILRACKALYPGQHTEVFTAVNRMVETMLERRGGSKPEVIKQMVAAPGTLSITMHTSSVSVPLGAQAGSAPKSLDELPPEIRQKVREAMASGKTSVTIRTRSASVPTPASQPVFHCKRCGYVEPGEFDRCPHCSTRKRRGLLRWLFGR